MSKARNLSKLSPDSNGALPSASIGADAITQEKVADDAIGLNELSATGTPSSSTFLRGDNSWQTVTQTRVSGGTTGLTPNTLTSGDVTLGGVLVASNGGTGLSSPGTSGNILVSNGSTWVSQAPAASGKVLQVKQSVITSALVQTGGNWSTWVDLSGYSFSITPSSSSSRILYQISFGAMTQSTNAIVFRLVRNGTIIGVGDASGSRPQATFRNMREGDANHTRTAPHFTYLDSPGTTSSVEYKLQWTGEGSPTIYINRAQNDTDGQSYGARTISTITLWEIAP
jgi:hypothetical protein